MVNVLRHKRSMVTFLALPFKAFYAVSGSGGYAQTALLIQEEMGKNPGERTSTLVCVWGSAMQWVSWGKSGRDWSITQVGVEPSKLDLIDDFGIMQSCDPKTWLRYLELVCILNSNVTISVKQDGVVLCVSLNGETSGWKESDTPLYGARAGIW
jgi:hypothetical protein